MNSAKNQTRWILGYDASCYACSGIAERIDAIVGETLTVMGLQSESVQAWRLDALGPDAPWSPTLIRVTPNGVDAWTGIALAPRLTQLLGPRKAVQVARMVGEQTIEPALAVPSRRRLLKMMVGTGAAGALIGMGKLPVLASAFGTETSAGSNAGRRTVSDIVGRGKDALLALYQSGPQYAAFSEYLMVLGFEPVQGPFFRKVDDEGREVRKFVVESWRSTIDSDHLATIALSIEAHDGNVYWYPRVFSSPTKVTQLAYADDGTISEQTMDPDVGPEAFPWPSRCSLCKNVCVAGLKASTVGGCVALCSAACGPAALICGGICTPLCYELFDQGTGGQCQTACQRIGAC